MAQATAMGPPLSPRETRRSGRRSLPSASTSASKSPDSDPPPRQKEVSNRPPLTSNNSSGRQKRLKQEDLDETVDEGKNGSLPSTSSTSSAHAVAAGRAKRQAKVKDKQITVGAASGGETFEAPQHLPLDAAEEEEQGITRCVCGSTEDDPDAGEFMVQCETCKVWQHGLCMGFESEDQLHDDDYYCEECKPELHADLFKKRSKRPRQSSANLHHNSAPVPSRVSRSHSPSTLLKQPSKRRNTMNSRDAAFDESLKEIIEATAAEAAAANDNASVTSGGNRDGQQAFDEETDNAQSSRRKRKRTEDDAAPKKRTRSASTTSDHRESVVARGDTPGQNNKGLAQPPAPPTKPARSNKRGAKKVASAAITIDTVAAVDSEEGLPLSTTKRQGNSSRAKTSHAPKRPSASHSNSHGGTGGSHEYSTRRVHPGGLMGQITGSSTIESSRAYRNSHAYAVSQQPLYTSWNLPDYLAHLEPMLPTEAPQPLEVRGSTTASGVGRGESVDCVVERGVRVKWPSKRMSVGDMNKRVRSLVEWVGREQAFAQDRMRRRDALSKALQEESKGRRTPTGEPGCVASGAEGGTMIVGRAETEVSELPNVRPFLDARSLAEHTPAAPIYQLDNMQSTVTMKMMEELMEELIGFQERFGPGARNRERERKLVSA